MYPQKSIAAIRLQLTTRHVGRLQKQFEEAGILGLVSARRGKPSNRQLAPGLAQMALQIVREHYADYAPTLACEKLRERHGVEQDRLPTAPLALALFMGRRAAPWITKLHVKCANR